MLETQVLIVGAGPVGLMAALTLSHFGVASLIVDRRFERMSAPKAHAVNARTLEICEGLGLSAEAVRATGAPPDEAGWVRFVSTLNGVELGHLPYERQQDDVKDVTPFPLSNIAQPDFEALLAGALEGRSDVGLWRGCEYLSLDDRQDHVIANLRHRGSLGPIQVKSRYVLAADGANSPIRTALGIELEGPADLQHNMMIHFEADLRHLTKARPGILYFLFDPDNSGVLIAYDLGKSWVLMHPFDPATTSATTFDEAACIALVEKAVGEPLPEVRIRNVGPWSMCAQVAAQYAQGNVFLAGDAAHRFPPTGGLGLNTGIGDAQNIAWKIGAVMNGWAGPGLLSTYETERQPVALLNSQQSLENAGRMFELFGSLYGPDPANMRGHFDKVIAAPETHAGLTDAIEFQRPHFDSLNLQQGYRYVSEAVIDATPTDLATLDISAYRPACLAGERVPHRWVQAGGREASLLSLLPVDRFSLIVGPSGDAWATIATSLTVPCAVLKDGTDYVAQDTCWADHTGLPDDGALLLRPDGHIALRCGAASDDAAATLHRAMDQLLARSL